MNNTKIELICLDLDGTLLNSKHQMSEESIAVLRMLEEKGMKIAIVTGRGSYEARKYAKHISENTFYIGSNGAIVGGVKHSIMIANHSFTQSHMDELMLFSNNYNLYPVLQAKDKQYISGFSDYIIHIYFTKILQKQSIRNLVFMPFRKRLKKQLDHQKVSIFKAMFFIKNKKKIKMIESKLRKHTEFELAITNNICFEITEKGMNKSRGIQELARYLDIDKSQIMAFGDSENDKEMLKYVGCGIAMGNATNELKSVANYITDTNDNEGISKVLYNVLNNQFVLT